MICFVSLCSVAHTDFGGGGFGALALVINERYPVKWLLSREFNDEVSKNKVERVTRHLRERGIANVEDSQLNMRGNHLSDNELSAFDSLFFPLEPSLLFIDRICRRAAIWAECRGVPYVVVGAGGGIWEESYNRVLQSKEIRPIGATARFAGRYGLSRSAPIWANSSLLNISFFPKGFYQSTKNSVACRPVQEAGAAFTDAKTADAADYILVTFGNSMLPSVKAHLVNCSEAFLQSNSNENILLLTGNEFDESLIPDELRALNRFSLVTWADYGQAFERSSVAVGHGGTAHIWHGINARVPTLSIPCLADQMHNAKRAKALGFGRYLFPPSTRTGLRLVRQLHGGGSLDEGGFARTMHLLRCEGDRRTKDVNYDFASLCDVVSYMETSSILK